MRQILNYRATRSENFGELRRDIERNRQKCNTRNKSLHDKRKKEKKKRPCTCVEIYASRTSHAYRFV